MREETRIIMGMPVTIGIVDEHATTSALDAVFVYFTGIDQRFSTYKNDSEVSRINAGDLSLCDISDELREVLALAEKTKIETDGYFDVRKSDGSLDPSGIVKGWAIRNAALMLKSLGFQNYFVEAGGDIQTSGCNAGGGDWTSGIRNPFNETEIIKAVRLCGRGIATSGNYVRGAHIYNPNAAQTTKQSDIVSLTVIGSDVLEADRFATAAFAMGDEGIYFIEETDGLEGYMVNASGIATQTTGFGALVIS